MIPRYLETRGRVRQLPINMLADVMRHLHARQRLGKALIVVDEPARWLPMAQKQWLKLSRTIQRRRAASSDAATILRYTAMIAQMQQMEFWAGSPEERPEATVYIAAIDEVRLLAPNCLSVYVAAKAPEKSLGRLIAELPASGLVVDYMGQLETGDFGLRPKVELEAKVAASWRAIETFFTSHDMDLGDLSRTNTEKMDDLLDVLLGVEAEFRNLAFAFQHALNMAQPLRTFSKTQRERYDALIMLAYRLQTLTSGAAVIQYLNSYADDSFFLNDRPQTRDLGILMAWHREAGRLNLARALAALRNTGPVMLAR